MYNGEITCRLQFRESNDFNYLHALAQDALRQVAVCPGSRLLGMRWQDVELFIIVSRCSKPTSDAMPEITEIHPLIDLQANGADVGIEKLGCIAEESARVLLELLRSCLRRARSMQHDTLGDT